MWHFTFGLVIRRKSIAESWNILLDERRANFGHRGIGEGSSGKGVGLVGRATCGGTGVGDGEGGGGDGRVEIVHRDDIVEASVSVTSVRLIFNV